MKKNLLTVFALFYFVFFISNTLWAQLLIENFDYPQGDSLINHNWVNHSGTGSLITVTSGSLSYPIYPGSGIGNSTTLNGGSGSREDIHTNFTPVASGSLYVGLLLNVSTASTTGDYFFHLAPAFPTTFFKPRLFVKDDGSGNLQFGISKSSTSSVVYTTTTYSYNTTYFLVLKYNMLAGDSNDVGSLYINPPVGKEPAAADITSTDFTVPDDTIATVCLRQGSQAYAAQIDGIFINTSWPTTFSKAFTISSGWNLVSFPGIHPNSMVPDTLFRFRETTTSVYKFTSSGYETEDTLEVGSGYWLKHPLQKTYNWNGTVQSSVLYPKLIYSPINPLAGISGWNIIGCYDYEFLTSDIITNPTGLINGPLFTYNPGVGYQVAFTVQPGKAYWVNLSGSGDIIYPNRPTFLKEFENNFINDSWPKIIITDAASNQYTLYLTTGENQLNQYQLPPKPPLDLFDVRFTTGRFVDDLLTEKTIDITGAQYPIRIRVEGIDLNLKDAFSGDILNTKINNGEEFVIFNESLNKLTILALSKKHLNFELSQNYPNPFNPTTKIRYTLPNNQFVSLKVYNSIGEEVALIVNEQQQAGSYAVDFNAERLVSGIYFYQIVAGKFVETKKMILLK